jgi:hypothetical protein
MLIEGRSEGFGGLVRRLFEDESQFFIHYKNGKSVRVAFHKGTWRVMRENGDFFEFTDAPQVYVCANPLLKGLLEEKISSLSKDEWFKVARELPAAVMEETLRIWAAPTGEIATILITQHGRDGWFTNFED